MAGSDTGSPSMAVRVKALEGSAKCVILPAPPEKQASNVFDVSPSPPIDQADVPGISQ